MKTLLALLFAGTLTASEPEVLKHDLIGFTPYPNNVLAVEWDLNGDGAEDLKVWYFYKQGAGGIYTTPKPWAYWQDLNFDGIYQDNEKFTYTSHNDKKTSK